MIRDGARIFKSDADTFSELAGRMESYADLEMMNRHR